MRNAYFRSSGSPTDQLNWYWTFTGDSIYSVETPGLFERTYFVGSRSWIILRSVVSSRAQLILAPTYLWRSYLFTSGWTLGDLSALTVCLKFDIICFRCLFPILNFLIPFFSLFFLSFLSFTYVHLPNLASLPLHLNSGFFLSTVCRRPLFLFVYLLFYALANYYMRLLPHCSATTCIHAIIFLRVCFYYFCGWRPLLLLVVCLCGLFFPTRRSAIVNLIVRCADS